MEKVYLFCDSAADIPAEEVKRYEIDIVPIHITHAGKTFREYYDMTPQQYWDLLESSDEIPTTAQLTPAQVLECYERACAQGCTHILGILINGNGSGCYQSCCIARDMFYEQYGRTVEIVLLDSRTYTYIYGQVLVELGQKRAAGASFEELVAFAKERLPRREAVLGVYTLKHLKKSGRISGGAAFVGEALGLKPISLVSNGAVTVIGKARGEKNLIPSVLQQVEKRVVNPQQQTAVLLYGKIPPEQLDAIEQALRHTLHFAAVQRVPIGASVTTNTGPKAFAVAYDGHLHT